MPGIDLTIFDDVIRRLTEPGGVIANDIERRSRNVLNQAILMAPVDTGRMRASGISEPSTEVSGAWEVSFPVDYSLYVDQGTRFMTSRPFLSDALPAALD